MSSSIFKSNKICDIAELEHVAVSDNGDVFVPLSETFIAHAARDDDFPLSTGQTLYVRQDVAARLEAVQKSLPKNVTLDVAQAYRTPEIQENAFRHVLEAQIERSARAIQYLSEGQLRQDWIRSAHRLIAAPEVAGHSTGGVVDVRLRDKVNRVIDMGTQMHDVASPFAAYHPSHVYDFTPSFQKNRVMLREAMCDAGFAPSNTRHWQFSYGDREHAVMHGRDQAIYAQRVFDHEAGEVRSYNAMPSHDILDEVIKAKKIKFAR
jgi:D-alanyl-D-alanine dipeptidase